MGTIKSEYQVQIEGGGGYKIKFHNIESKSARFWLNGMPIIGTTADEQAVVDAFTALDTAIARLAVNRMKIEEAFRDGDVH